MLQLKLKLYKLKWCVFITFMFNKKNPKNQKDKNKNKKQQLQDQAYFDIYGNVFSVKIYTFIQRGLQLGSKIKKF